MPWNMQDYPSSLKNLDTAVRKKAIDIANTMLEEGYKEGEAIPIATEQAKEWQKNASDKEIEQLKQASQKEIESADGDDSARPELTDKDVYVKPHENGWAVQSKSAKQPSDTFSEKQEAVSRAEEIARNKETSVIVQKQDGSTQKTYKPS
ncbi:DUF2188 domain-containing protein [Bacillus daqingensis]|uniref:DUF2188 domain-containing protein n=2 Tax=Bacillaceae TaxID=186817 RepID=A0A969PSD2_9BACI|nr:DUF2188 domain-containing protein [Alkalicoccus luteus]NJP38488.1 DUF2188 domain-containing protein [Alkalicoccus luteus]